MTTQQTFYCVYHESLSGRDGDSKFDRLRDAEIRFDDLVESGEVVLCELQEITPEIMNSDNEPKVLRRWNA